MTRTVAMLLATIVLTGFSASAPAQDDIRYVIQPGDVLQVSVWKEDGLQGDVLVRPDGYLSFPLAGDIEAAGRNVEDIRKVITERLDPYIPKPVVTVSVKGISGNRFFVLGKVVRPGEFPLNGPLDVMQALSLAGGGTTFADLDSIRILRRQGLQQKVLRFRYSTVAGGRDLSSNILLQSGDTVVVP